MTPKFSEKARKELEESHKMGSAASKKKKAKPPRNFEEEFEAATHKSTDGWFGIPAAAFRAAMVRACKLAGFAMTDAKVSIFVEADGYDETSFQPLVRIYGNRECSIDYVRNETGVIDLRARPIWRNWYANVRIEYNADVFNTNEIANILARAGRFIGIGEGRNDSKKSVGIGYGCFDVTTGKKTA